MTRLLPILLVAALLGGCALWRKPRPVVSATWFGPEITKPLTIPPKPRGVLHRSYLFLHASALVRCLAGGSALPAMPHRLVFMGSDSIALPALEWIRTAGRDVAEIVAVYTQPDRPHGRGQRLEANAIKRWALVQGLPVLQPEKLTPGDLAGFAALGADAVLVMAYGHILRQDWIDAPRCGIWNLHASLLPKLRGASPIQGAIAGGEAESGVCLMRLVLRLDAGPMLDAESVPIGAHETGATLEEKIAAACVPLVQRRLATILTSDPPLVAQDDTQATFTRRLRKEDGRLDFGVPAAVLARRINALFPWPGAYFSLGDETIRVGLAEAAAGATSDATPGTVLPARDALAVAAGSAGVVRLLRLQRPGGRMLAADEFLRGHAITPGTVLPSLPMPELIGSRPFKG